MAKTIQFSAFTAEPGTADVLTLLTTCFRGAEVKSMDSVGQQKRAVASFGGFDVQVMAGPGRIDVHIYRESDPGEPTNKDIEPQEAIPVFKAPFLAISESHPTIRLALIMGAAEEVGSREEAVAKVAEKLCIKSVPKTLNELEGRFNSPTDLNGVPFNRNITWHVTETSLLFATPGMGLQQQSSYILVGQQLDVNTGPKFLLQKENIPQAFDDLCALALPLVGRGMEVLDD